MSLFAGVMLFIGSNINNESIKLSTIALIFGLVSGFLATAFMWYRLPLVAGIFKNSLNKSFSDDKITVPIIALLAIVFSISLGIWGTQIIASAPLLWGLILSSAYAIATSTGIYFAKRRQESINTRVNWRWLYWCTFLGALPIFVLGYILPHMPGWIHEILFGIGIAKEQSDSIWFLAGIISPIVCLLLTLAVSIHLGIVGRAISSEAYFWVSRVAAWMAQYALGFALPAAIFLFFLPLLDWTEATLTVGGIFASFAIVARWLAAGAETGPNMNSQAGWKEKLTGGIVTIAPFILVFALLGFVSLGVRSAFEKPPCFCTEDTNKYQSSCYANLSPVTKLLNPEENSNLITFKTLKEGLPGYPVDCIPSFKDYFQLNILALDSITWPAPYAIGNIAIVIAWFLGLLINANLFSLHTYYRNRLSNAYLAASNISVGGNRVERDPDIGVHADDAIALENLADIKPYLIVNTTLNLAGKDKDLAWQDRKATSFVMTPLYCGYVLDGAKDYSMECFQETGSYAHKNRAAYKTKNEEPPNEYSLKLDLAMTISGAAASPLGGFHTKPWISLLMALGGVRLGWWLSNPANEQWWQGQSKRCQFSSDTPLLTTLYKEMFSEADEKHEKVYLSDGGGTSRILVFMNWYVAAAL